MERWITFNGVGIAGAAVQLAALTIAMRANVPVAIATLLAVEAAILHNFVWHQRLTWRDRPVKGGQAVLHRLVRFHALNGAVSLCGNLIVTTSLAAAGIHPLIANVVAITICSMVNFLLGDRIVFSRRVATVAGTTIGLAAVLIAAPNTATAAGPDDATVLLVSGPSPAAVAAFDKYAATVAARHAKPSTDQFFALDMRRIQGWRERAKSGNVPMTEVDPPGAPDSKIHHWAGAIYVPNMTVDSVLDRLQKFAGREQEFYEEVKASKLLGGSGDRVRVFLRLERGAMSVSATLNTEHDVQYLRFGSGRAGSRSVSTKIAELQDVGKSTEREREPGKDRGFLWRLNAYWRYEQVGDGVLIECESVSLSRDVPLWVRPIASPIVDRIARESLERTLRSLRKFLSAPAATS